MGLVSWIIFGALAGWIASIITGRNERMGCLGNIAVGVVGALIGGFLMSFIGRGGVSGFNLPSFFVAVLGAVLLLTLTGWGAKK